MSSGLFDGELTNSIIKYFFFLIRRRRVGVYIRDGDGEIVLSSIASDNGSLSTGFGTKEFPRGDIAPLNACQFRSIDFRVVFVVFPANLLKSVRTFLIIHARAGKVETAFRDCRTPRPVTRVHRTVRLPRVRVYFEFRTRARRLNRTARYDGTSDLVGLRFAASLFADKNEWESPVKT